MFPLRKSEWPIIINAAVDRGGRYAKGENILGVKGTTAVLGIVDCDSTCLWGVYFMAPCLDHVREMFSLNLIKD